MDLCYENIHCHTYYSNPYTLPDSPTSMEAYAAEYKKRNMQCLIFSEHSYRSDVWRAADLAQALSDDTLTMKAICAAEVYFVPDRLPDAEGKYDGRNFHLLLLAKNNDGFRQLNKALSESQLTGYYKSGRLDFDLLSQLDYKNFMCTTACVAGVLRDELGEQYACQLAEIFKENFRLEVQYHNNEDQARHNAKVLRLYKKYKWPLIMATDSHYVNRNEKILRKELQLSAKIEMDDSGWDLYLPTAQEAYDDFVRQNVLSKAQIEEAFENTLEVRSFEGFSYDTTRKFPIAKDKQNMSDEERCKLYQKMVCDGYIKQCGMPDAHDAAELRKEMNTIIETHSYDYFIGLCDMIRRGQELGGILTTTSRGSACGFATNFALGLTSINRLHTKVKMFPDRFISKAYIDRPVLQ